MARRAEVGSLLSDQRRNAALTWILVGFLALGSIGSAIEGDLLWLCFVGILFSLCVLPPIAYKDPLVMLPWEVVGMAALPVLGRIFATVRLTSDLATYLSVAAVALVIAVQLHAFTNVQMNQGFAIFFVVVTTLAAAGTWAVARWAADVHLGTTFLVSPGMTGAELDTALETVMWEFVYSAVAGILAGMVFELYFRRRAPIEPRVPKEVMES